MIILEEGTEVLEKGMIIPENQREVVSTRQHREQEASELQSQALMATDINKRMKKRFESVMRRNAPNSVLNKSLE